MFGIQKNIRLKPYKEAGVWRKLSVATWDDADEACFYGWVDFDAAGINKTLENFRAQGKKLSVTTIAAKGLAVAISAYPKVNGLLRFGRIYNRETIDIFLQVAPDADSDELTGIVIRECDRKSLEEINDEIKIRTGRIKKEGEDEFKTIGTLTKWFPPFALRMMLKLAAFINYDLNLWASWMGTPRDAFGSAMVTSVGMLGIQRGLAPLMPHSRCPVIITIGRLEEKPVVKDGKVVVAEVLPLSATMDHRLIDGVGASKMFKALTEYLKEPY